MLQRLTGQLPEWARPEHPILRHEIARMRESGTFTVRFVQFLFLALVLGGIGYLYALYVAPQPLTNNITDIIWRIVFFPALIVQVILRLIAVTLGVNSVNEERQRRTWDKFRSTEVGAELRLRTRWVAIFYRLRGLIGGVMLVRIVLIIGILYDLTAFRGGYLDILTANITPEMSVFVGVIMLAFLMTAGLILPLTSLGVDIALGILITVAIKDRAYASILYILWILFRLILVFGFLIAMTQFLQNTFEPANTESLLLVAGYSAFADWGLFMMQLGAAGEIWAIVPFSIFMGIILLGFALVQAIISDGLLALAVRLSERRE